MLEECCVSAMRHAMKLNSLTIEAFIFQKVGMYSSFAPVLLSAARECVLVPIGDSLSVRVVRYSASASTISVQNCHGR